MNTDLTVESRQNRGHATNIQLKISRDVSGHGTARMGVKSAKNELARCDVWIFEPTSIGYLQRSFEAGVKDWTNVGV